ncbi:MAG: OsmC family protein, partial [Akkermansiaceae bacterium]|nr:OsmC family protein [Akkermansiaceae bacterium]
MTHPDYTSATTLSAHMRCTTRFCKQQATMVTDIPAAIGGLGEFPTPAQYLTATLASCMMSMLAFTGKQKGFSTDDISVEALCHEDKSGIRAFELTFRVPHHPEDKIKRLMEASVRSCPVANALHPGIGKNITWIYPTID